MGKLKMFRCGLGGSGGIGSCGMKFGGGGFDGGGFCIISGIGWPGIRWKNSTVACSSGGIIGLDIHQESGELAVQWTQRNFQH